MIKNKLKKIAIVILNYNNTDDTLELIKSINKCIVPKDFEKSIILIDNSKSDFYLKKILSQVNVNHFRRVENYGYAHGNNIGIKLALDDNAEFIIILNNDTIVENHFIEQILEAYYNLDSPGLIAPLIYYYDEPNQIWSGTGRFNRILFKHKMIRQHISTNTPSEFINGCAFMVHRSVINNIGMIPEEYFMYGEDSEYSLLSIRHGYSNYVSNKAVIYHKVSRSSGIGTPFTLFYIYRNRLHYIRRNYKSIYKYYGITITTIQILFKALMFLVKGKTHHFIACINAIFDKALGRNSKY